MGLIIIHKLGKQGNQRASTNHIAFMPTLLYYNLYYVICTLITVRALPVCLLLHQNKFAEHMIVGLVNAMGRMSFALDLWQIIWLAILLGLAKTGFH